MGFSYSVARILLDGLLGAATGWKVYGREHIPRSGGFILASNHASYSDPPLVGVAAVRELHFLAKEELFKPPVFGALIRHFHAIPIRRGKMDAAGMARAIEVLKAGHALVVFPEGTRSRDGVLRPARPGAGIMAAGAGVPIVPCWIWGSNRPKEWFLGRGRLGVAFGPARTWQELAGDAAGDPQDRVLYQKVVDAVMRDIAALSEKYPNEASRGTA